MKVLVYKPAEQAISIYIIHEMNKEKNFVIRKSSLQLVSLLLLSQ